MECDDDGGRDLGLRRMEARASGHVSARPVQTLYLIRGGQKSHRNIIDCWIVVNNIWCYTRVRKFETFEQTSQMVSQI
jgi:hypothetical protein